MVRVLTGIVLTLSMWMLGGPVEAGDSPPATEVADPAEGAEAAAPGESETPRRGISEPQFSSPADGWSLLMQMRGRLEVMAEKAEKERWLDDEDRRRTRFVARRMMRVVRKLEEPLTPGTPAYVASIRAGRGLREYLVSVITVAKSEFAPGIEVYIRRVDPELRNFHSTFPEGVLGPLGLSAGRAQGPRARAR